MERKIVALIRKYRDQPFPLNKMDEWLDNMDTVHEAVKLKGYEELYQAVMCEEIKDEAYRRVVFEFMPDPLTYAKECEALVEKYKQYL